MDGAQSCAPPVEPVEIVKVKNLKEKRPRDRLVRQAKALSAISLVALWISACTTSPTTNSPTTGGRAPTEPPRGFFERLADEFTERECNVFRFTCPYGLGPAGEPCECTEPNGVVLKGRTIK